MKKGNFAFPNEQPAILPGTTHITLSTRLTCLFRSYPDFSGTRGHHCERFGNNLATGITEFRLETASLIYATKINFYAGGHAGLPRILSHGTG